MIVELCVIGKNKKNMTMNITPIYSAKEADTKIEVVRKRDNKTTDKFWFKNTPEALAMLGTLKNVYDLRIFQFNIYVRTTDRTWCSYVKNA